MNWYGKSESEIMFFIMKKKTEVDAKTELWRSLNDENADCNSL